MIEETTEEQRPKLTVSSKLLNIPSHKKLQSYIKDTTSSKGDPQSDSNSNTMSFMD